MVYNGSGVAGVTKDIDKRIEAELTQIEYPGEDRTWMVQYLDERDFVDRVMQLIVETHVRVSRSTIWAMVTAVNLIVLIVAGLNPYLVEDALALKDQLFTFFYVFFGLTLSGCIVGLVISLDLSRIEQFIQELFRHNN